jgi:hypothetical protein
MALRIAKILISIALVFAYLSGTNQCFVYFIAFQINHDFIVEQLCIERDNEVNTCQGCCQQEKFLEQETANESNEIIPIFPENSLATHLINGNFLYQIIQTPDSPPPEIS